jgi:hypothetical protein
VILTFGAVGDIVAWDAEGALITRLASEQQVTLSQLVVTGDLWQVDEEAEQ